MHHPRVLDRVRTTIRHTLNEIGADESTHLQETILIRDGQYCGRRFLLDGLEAIWFVEEQQIKYYGRDGRVVKVCKGEQIVRAYTSDAAVA